MRSQKTKRSVSRQDVKALADAIAKEIVHWCYHHSGDSVIECLIRHIQFADYNMYVPKEYEKLYQRILRSRKKTAALDHAVETRLMKAAAKLKRATGRGRRWIWVWEPFRRK
jgi:uncharacterized protein YecT (DUF1311 family)